MASRAYQLLRILGVGRAVIAGRFFPLDTVTPVNANNKGKGYTVARTGQGIYLITLDDKYRELIHFGATVQTTLATSWTASFGVYTVPTTPAPATIELRTRQGGTLADLTAGADNSVAFWLTFSNSSVVF